MATEMTGTARVEGLRELEDELLKLEKLSTRKSLGRRVLKKAGQPMADLMERLAPDDPTTPPVDLHTSIEISSRQKSGGAKSYAKPDDGSVEMHIGPTKDGYPQAVMQEFGTVHHDAQPFIRPAWDREARPTLDRIKKFLGEDIVKALKRQAKRNARQG